MSHLIADGCETVDATCQALMMNQGRLELGAVRRPRCRSQEVLVRVRAVGLCRTDLKVMRGQIPTDSGLIPGHEFSGTVDAVGDGVDHVTPGDTVAVNPVRSCGRCSMCRASQTHRCQAVRFMGLDVAGACAEWVVIPAADVYRLPMHVPFATAAFAEPIAACLAVLSTGIRAHERGVICGDNRIGRLVAAILNAHRFTSVDVCSASDVADLPTDAFEFVIETEIDSTLLCEMVRIVQPRGRIVLKSRQHRQVSFVPGELLPKEPILCFANYAPFAEAVRLLAQTRIDVGPLFGASFPLRRFREALDEAERSEARKTFLTLNEA